MDCKRLIHSTGGSMTMAAALLGQALLVSGCNLTQPSEYQPEADLETAFKHAGFEAPVPEGSWWKLFRDPQLTALIERAESSAPTARAALARYDQARAALRLARADASPTVTADAYARRQGDSDNANFSGGTFNDYRAALNLSWEVDLWGRVRRMVAAAAAEDKAAGYEYQAALLSLRGEIARAYLSLRFADAELELLEETLALRREAQRLMRLRFERGVSSQIDDDRATTEYESVAAEIAQLRARRSRFENAIAALAGESASKFDLSREKSRPIIPNAPGAVPSDLLRRRPDIAAAERRVAAASERIGVVTASYFPRVSLTGVGGVRSLRSSDLFNPESVLWNLGPQVTLPVYQGNRFGGERARALAVHQESLESYRDLILRSVQETEDALVDATMLAKAAAAHARGARSAERAATLTRKRYLGGITDYFEVVDADRTALTEHRAALSNDLARALATTRLIQSLGGGWTR